MFVDRLIWMAAMLGVAGCLRSDEPSPLEIESADPVTASTPADASIEASGFRVEEHEFELVVEQPDDLAQSKIDSLRLGDAISVIDLVQLALIQTAPPDDPDQSTVSLEGFRIDYLPDASAWPRSLPSAGRTLMWHSSNKAPRREAFLVTVVIRHEGATPVIDPPAATVGGRALDSLQALQRDCSLQRPEAQGRPWIGHATLVQQARFGDYCMKYKLQFLWFVDQPADEGGE